MPRTYACCTQLLWVQDTNSILVVDRRALRHHCFQGVEAAVWRWLSLSYPASKLVEELAFLQSTTLSDAHRTLLAMLEQWTASGLLDQQAVEDYD